MRYSRLNKLLCALLAACVPVYACASEALTGERTVQLVGSEGERLNIASIRFSGDGDRISYELQLDSQLFSDEFLSMRPFKCIRHDAQMLCHLQYPYRLQGYINADDLTDLEYDLLFLHKAVEEYGIDAWNGLYYRMHIDADRISGQLHEVDLNVLAAPPENDELRPITGDMLHPADPAHHAYPGLLIQ